MLEDCGPCHRQHSAIAGAVVVLVATVVLERHLELAGSAELQEVGEF